MPELPVPADEPLDAYALLSKPTLALTDREVAVIVEDLRKRRALHLSSGKPDKPKVEAKAKKEPTSAEAKKLNTQALLAQLQLKMPGAQS